MYGKFRGRFLDLQKVQKVRALWALFKGVGPTLRTVGLKVSSDLKLI